VAHGLTFGCRLASIAPFSTLAAPVAARWHCTAPTTELRKTYSEFAPSRPRSFRQCQFSGDAKPAVAMIATKKYGNTVLSADERRWTQINSNRGNDWWKTSGSSRKGRVNFQRPLLVNFGHYPMLEHECIVRWLPLFATPLRQSIEGLGRDGAFTIWVCRRRLSAEAWSRSLALCRVIDG